MTGLEAIEIIRDRLIEYKNKAEGTNIKCLISPQFAQVRTELKALEIIKEKNVNIYWFKSELTLRNISYRYYVNNFGSFHNGLVVKLLDEEEFNLLKEVLE